MIAKTIVLLALLIATAFSQKSLTVDLLEVENKANEKTITLEGYNPLLGKF